MCFRITQLQKHFWRTATQRQLPLTHRIKQYSFYVRINSVFYSTKPNVQGCDQQWHAQEHVQQQQSNNILSSVPDRRSGGSSSGFALRQGRLVSTVTINPVEEGAKKSSCDCESQTLTTIVVSSRQKQPRITNILGIRSADGLKEETTATQRAKQWANATIQAFLPSDYKTSMSPEYLSYAKWQFVHNVLGAASGVLATQTMLYAMGLGAGVLPLSAAINWVIKDGFGQLGGVIYATMVGQKFDSDPKHQRFWSAVWLQTATWLEMLTPLFPHLFVVIGSVANIGKNISWLAMSATKASINKTFCLRENLGDLTAKHGSQSTAAGLIGTALGILIGGTMDISVYTLILGFIPISIASLWGNYKSLLYTITPTLNVERTRHMLDEAILSRNGDLVFVPELLKTPRQVSSVERFMREINYVEPSGWRPGIVISPKINKLHCDIASYGSAGNAKALALQMIDEVFRPPVFRGNRRSYFVGYLHQSMANGAKNGNVYLWFSSHAENTDILQGLYHAIALQQLFCDYAQQLGIKASDPAVSAEINRRAREFVDCTTGIFCESVVQKGWDITTVYFSKKSQQIEVESI